LVHDAGNQQAPAKPVRLHRRPRCEAGQVISAPGGTEPVYEKGKLKPLMQAERVIDHGHDVCVLENGDLIVCQWNAFQTYPVLLEKVRA